MGAPQVNQTPSALNMKHKAHIHPESIECFTEGQAAPSPVSNLSFFLSLPVCRRSSLLRGQGGGRGWAWSRITWPHKSLALYISFNTVWHPLIIFCTLNPRRKHRLLLAWATQFTKINGTRNEGVVGIFNTYAVMHRECPFQPLMKWWKLSEG